MDCSTPDFSVLNYLPEFAQTHVIWSVMPSNHLIHCLPFLFLPSNFPSFQLQGLFQWVGSSHQVSIGASASASVLPMNIQGWFPLGLIGLISLLFKECSKIFPSTTIWNYQIFGLLYSPTLTFAPDYMTIRTFLSKMMSLLYNMLSRFVIAFLPWRKHLEFCCCSYCS